MENASTTARRAMIDCQLRTSGVTESAVINRMNTVERENFVPDAAKGVAYMDRAIPLADGGFLAAPLVQGMILQEAAPKADEHAIVIDGGSGYLAELLRPLVASVRVMTPQDALKPARGGKKADLILIEGAAEHIPASLAKRLADKGRVVTGLSQDGVNCLACGRKSGAQVALLPVAEVGMPRLSAFDKPKGWSF